MVPQTALHGPGQTARVWRFDVVRVVFMKLRVVVPAAVLLLFGCATEEIPEPCPPVGLVDGLARVSAFEPQASVDPGRKLWSAYLADLRSECTLGSRGMLMTVGFLVLAERGPANADGIARQPFFVAVTGPDGRILAKQEFGLELTFEGEARRVIHQEVIEPFLPGTGQPWLDYRILVGFQLSEAQVMHNRRGAQPRF